MPIDFTLYEKACENYQEEWSLTDEILYDLCAAHPAHRYRREVNAKLWLIGRTYATGIERKSEATGQQGGALERVARQMYERGREVDKLLGTLGVIREPLDSAKLRIIVQAHGQFTALIVPVLRKWQTPRAFASKYLHFHCPAVPIYDTWASTGLRHLHLGRMTPEFECPEEGDSEYYRYTTRFLHVYRELRQLRPEATVRLIDRYLVEKADARRRG